MPARMAALYADRTSTLPPNTAPRWLPRRVATPRAAAPPVKLWVFLELPNGIASPLLWGLVGEGRRLAESRGGELGAVLLGSSARALQEVALEAFAYGVDTVHMVEAPAFAHYDRQSFTGALAGLVERYKPAAVLFAASPVACDLADNLAAALGLTTSDQVCELADDRLAIAAITPDAAATPERQDGRAGHIIVEPLWATGWARGNAG